MCRSRRTASNICDRQLSSCRNSIPYPSPPGLTHLHSRPVHVHGSPPILLHREFPQLLRQRGSIPAAHPNWISAGAGRRRKRELCACAVVLPGGDIHATAAPPVLGKNVVDVLEPCRAGGIGPKTLGRLARPDSLLVARNAITKRPGGSAYPQCSRLKRNVDVNTYREW